MKPSREECFDNREFSWLKFNERVLEEACRRSCNPLLERLKFLSIFTSNLDEFYMVRVGTLTDYVKFFKNYMDSKTNLTALEQLTGIFEISRTLYQKRDSVYEHTLLELAEQNIFLVNFGDLTQEEKKKVKKHYKKNIFPLLSPQIIDVWHPFPFLQNKKQYIILELEGKKDKKLLGIVPVPLFIQRLHQIEGRENTFILVEQIIEYFAPELFSMYKVLDASMLCVTRNADIDTDCDVTDQERMDYRQFMKKVLKSRSRLAAVRLEMRKKMSKFCTSNLLKKLELSEQQLFVSQAPLDMGFAFALENILPQEVREKLVYPPYRAREDEMYVREQNLADLVFENDIFLHYPYDSMRTFLNLIKQASEDERVRSIKITLYRLATDSHLANYLINAAENGKEVTILMELRARFDEQNNIEWAQRFEEAGCKVIYGGEHYKVHSKICLITYQKEDELQFITHIGTGNYNEKTSRIYTDFSLITADDDIGIDADTFFKNMLMGNADGEYEKLWVAPTSFKQNILASIGEEIQKVKNGKEAGILIKCNSFTDKELIDALINASCEGVKITLIIRGICCLIPQVPGLTENIRVISIVGRFLEHSRLYSFGVGAEQKMYISSGDMMTRNTENRVEIACPVENGKIRQKLNAIVGVILKDNMKARELQKDKTYKRLLPENGEEQINSQEIFMQGESAYLRQD